MTEQQVKDHVARIDRIINETKFRIDKTEDEIQRLINLNDGRRKRLRALGQKRSEIMTFELF